MPTPLSWIGANLTSVNYYEPGIVFIDALKQARPWISQATGQGYGQGGLLDLDANGWVQSLQSGQWYETMVWRDVPLNQYPSGDYILLFEGEGDIEFQFGSATVVSQSPGRWVVNVPGPSADPAPAELGIHFKVSNINPANYLRNIRLITPGNETRFNNGELFHPSFLTRLAGFKMLRFMDWVRTNGHPNGDWANRSKSTDVFQSTDKGVCLEYCIELANTLGLTRAWFNIPHLANDSYVTSALTLIRDTLNPSCQALIEHSNEICFNYAPDFTQTPWAQQQGTNLGLGDPGGYQALLEYHSLRSRQIFDIADTVFGATRAQRVKRVVGGQAVNTWVNTQILDYNNLYQHADYLAIAPYLTTEWYGQSGNEAAIQAKTVDQVIDDHFDYLGSNGEVTGWIQANFTLCEQKGMQVVGYEGANMHLVASNFPNNQTILDLFLAVNRSPRMYDLTIAFFQKWNQITNGTPFNYFAETAGKYDNHGAWGASEWQDQPLNTAHKHRALVQLITQGFPTMPSNAMMIPFLADADMKGHGIYELLTATEPSQAVRYDQLTALEAALEAVDETLQDNIDATNVRIDNLDLGIDEAAVNALIQARLAITSANDLAAVDGDIAMNGYRITGLPNAVGNDQPMTLGQYLASRAGDSTVRWAVAAKWEGSPSDLVAANFVADGVTIAAGAGTIADAHLCGVLVVDAADSTNNGVYYRNSSGALVRPSALADADDYGPEPMVWVKGGTTHADELYVAAQTVDAGGGVFEVTFIPFGRVQNLIASGVIAKTGNTLTLTYNTSQFKNEAGALTLHEDVTNSLNLIPGIQTSVSDLGSRMGTAETGIGNLQVTVGNHGGDIASLQSLTSTHSSQITTLQNTDSTQQSAIAALQTSDTAQSTDIAALQTEAQTLTALVQQLQALTAKVTLTYTNGTPDNATISTAVDSVTHRVVHNLNREVEVNVGIVGAQNTHLFALTAYNYVDANTVDIHVPSQGQYVVTIK